MWKMVSNREREEKKKTESWQVRRCEAGKMFMETRWTFEGLMQPERRLFTVCGSSEKSKQSCWATHTRSETHVPDLMNQQKWVCWSCYSQSRKHSAFKEPPHVSEPDVLQSRVAAAEAPRGRRGVRKQQLKGERKYFITNLNVVEWETDSAGEQRPACLWCVPDTWFRNIVSPLCAFWPRADEKKHVKLGSCWQINFTLPSYWWCHQKKTGPKHEPR